jgi:hypothetical protein
VKGCRCLSPKRARALPGHHPIGRCPVHAHDETWDYRVGRRQGECDMGIWMPIWVLIVEFIVVAVTGVFAVVETIYRRWWNAGAESVKEELDRERQVKAHAEAASKEAARPAAAKGPAEPAKVPVPAHPLIAVPVRPRTGPIRAFEPPRTGPAHPQPPRSVPRQSMYVASRRTDGASPTGPASSFLRFPNRRPFPPRF